MINIKHTEIQDSIVKKLKEMYGEEVVFQEVVVNDSRLDVLVEIKSNNNTVYDIYEIKPYCSFYSCMREAIGQLIEYKYKAQEKGLNIRKLIIVGPAKIDEYYLKYIQKNCSNELDYMQIMKEL